MPGTQHWVLWEVYFERYRDWRVHMRKACYCEKGRDHYAEEPYNGGQHGDTE